MAMNTVKLLTLTVSGACAQDTPSLKAILDPVFYTFAGLVLVGMTLVVVYINRKKIVRFYRKKMKCFKSDTEQVSTHIYERSGTSAETTAWPDVEPAMGDNYELPVWENTYEQLRERQIADNHYGKLISSRAQPAQEASNDPKLRENKYEPLKETRENADDSYGHLHTRVSVNMNSNNSEETSGGMLYETLQKQNTTNDHPYGDASEATVAKQITDCKSIDNAGLYQPLQRRNGAQDHVYGETENTNNGLTDGLTDAINVNEIKTGVKDKTEKDKSNENLDVRQ